MKDTLTQSGTSKGDSAHLTAPDKAIFDQVIDRKNTGSLKWDKYVDKDVLPMWVADMDFAVAEPIQNALIDRLSHPIYGYTVQSNAFKQTIAEHLKREYNWTIDTDWLVFLPGVVTGLAVSCRAFCFDDDKIMVNPPIYHHFYAVFTRAELQQVGAMCAEHDMMIISDEIHCDLVIDKNSKHIPTAVACPEHADRIVTLMSASKTWNLAGLNASFAIVPNAKMREKFVSACQSIVPSTPPLAMVATQAAYSAIAS